MKQLLQNYKTGELLLAEVPPAQPIPNGVLVRNSVSLVSAGTERQMIDLARKNLIGKALARPDLVQNVLAVARTEGIGEAYQISKSRLETPIPLGYSCAGRVEEAGQGANGFSRNALVACAGSGYACHAEKVSVPRTLCVPVPPGVTAEEAAFVALGGIALHAVRLGGPGLGETMAVIGLGLLGLLAVQILAAAGCRVVGMDPSRERCRLAESLGCHAAAATSQTMQEQVAAATENAGCDAVYVFAAASTNEPIELAAEVAREGGRVVVPGLVKLNLPRNLFYRKELDLRISRAWGPGIYDPDYESGTRDYPYAFVRWTAQRNMAAFLDLVAKEQVKLVPLVTHRFPIEQAEQAYRLILKGEEPYIGVLLTYGDGNGASPTGPDRSVVCFRSPDGQSASAVASAKSREAREGSPRSAGIGLIGVGNFARATLLPLLQKMPGVHLRGVASATGASGSTAGRQFGFDYCTTDPHALLSDPQIDAVVIATRHDSHARLVREALAAGKHIFVEKPLCIDTQQLQELTASYVESTQKGKPVLMVGFNRRFSPLAQMLKSRLAFSELPMVIHCRVNAGFVPHGRWECDPVIGGGRIVGEMCHFVDLLQYFTDALPVEVFAQPIASAGPCKAEDNLIVSLKMSDGSVGSILYAACGDKTFPRERIEIFRGTAVGVLDNFKSASFTHQGRTRRKRRLLHVDRGHRAELEAFIHAIRKHEGGPVAFDDYWATTLTTFKIVESLHSGTPQAVHVVLCL